MRILIVCSGNTPDFSFEKHQAFIYDQTKSISKCFPKIEFDVFTIKGKGFKGYIANLSRLKVKLLEDNYDLIHAHYGLSGFLAILQRKVPVVTTFHNGEILSLKGKVLSSLTAIFSKYSIYVAKHIYKTIYYKPRKYKIIPCGIELADIVERTDDTLNYIGNEKQIKMLFGGDFNNSRKNYSLLKSVLPILKVDSEIKVIELKGFTRKEVYEVIHDCDIMVLPSLAEGSPQIIKEAMACNCPIVSTNVGDVKEVIGDTEGCYICSFEPVDVAEKIQMALKFARTKGRTNGRKRIIELGLDNQTIAKKIVRVYKNVLK